MAETKKKPFWMTAEEWNKQGLPKLEGNMSGAVTSGVPELKWVERGSLIGAYVEKDGLLIYHFYKRDRKQIYDNAQADLENTRDVADEGKKKVLQGAISVTANAELGKHPWWPTFKDVVENVFEEHFRFHPFKMDYYQEVDSWSVVMTELNTPVKWSATQLELPFSKIAIQLGG